MRGGALVTRHRLIQCRLIKLRLVAKHFWLRLYLRQRLCLYLRQRLCLYLRQRLRLYLRLWLRLYLRQRLRLYQQKPKHKEKRV
jgi:hypothetical protein